MRVLVTGGTGFIGAHTTRALIDAGHDVRLLVRTPARIAQNIGPLGIDEVDHVVGDMTAPDAVTRALEGCDAVVHAAAAVEVSARSAAATSANAAGARLVLETALERGLDPVVHVSSVAALFDPDQPILHTELPPGRPTHAYAKSKSEAEEHAREHQGAGAPLVIVYPGGVTGPPAGTAMGEINESVIARHLRYGVMPGRDGAISFVDVRDVAAVLAAAIEPGRGPRRYMVGGHFLQMREIAAHLRAVTGRRLPIPPITGGMLMAAGKAMDLASRFLPLDSPLSEESITLLTKAVPTDDSALAELGIRLRPARETFAASVSGLHAMGAISARQAGTAAVHS